MEGRCPGCNRAYDISEEFLSMGGKAKCPHCLLELEFDQSRPSSGADRFHDVTRADDRQHRLSYEDDLDEVDSHCPECERRFKVDRKYLDLGGAAQCPHCAVDLVFDSQPDEVAPEAHAPQVPDFGAEAGEADDWGESGEISLPELDELRVPTKLEEPPREEMGEAYEDDEVSFEDEVEEEGLPAEEAGSVEGETPAEEPAREETEDEDLADEMPTQLMDGPGPMDLEPGVEEEPARAGEPSEQAVEGESPESLAEELFGDEGAEAAMAEPSSEEVEAPVVVDDRPSPEGPFGALASNQDWASAAARWAESGFKADEMPSFIMGEEESVQEEAPVGEPEPPGGELFRSEAAEEAVEVSDADIMMLEASEADVLPQPAPRGAEPTWAKQASKEVEFRRAEKPPMAKAKRVAERPTWIKRLKSPPIIAAMLGGVVLLAVALLWVLMGGGEDVAAYTFPHKGLKAGVIKAPSPSDYKAKEQAVEHYGLGNRLAYQGKFEDAILEYKQASRLDPGYPHPHRALGAVYAALGKPKLSAAAYETYLRLSPHSADAGQVRQIIKATNE